ncbi:MAG: helix-turn-helix transcriptional regulator [Anaerolineales bacterium]
MPLESRQRILEHIKQSGQASVAELSQALALTPVTIRHHLVGLRSEGLVAEPVSRHKPGPGRPEMMYQVTPAANAYMPRNFGELCGCLIQAIESSQSLELEGLLVDMGSELGSSTRTAGQPAAAMIYLEERGYFPILEENGGLIILQFANCPYLELVQGAPSLCHFDRALIEALFGGEVEILGRIVDQAPVCTFQIST